MNKFWLLLVVFLCFPLMLCAQSSSENYIQSIDHKTPTTTGAVSSDEKIEVISYVDGLGRSKQVISAKAGGAKENIVQHFDYDGFGRTAKTYLPYATNTEVSGNYLIKLNEVSLKNDITNYYSSNYGDDFPSGVINAFSETHFEESPLSRPLEQGAPGESWSVDHDSDLDHTIKYEYQSNTQVDAVRLFRVGFVGDNYEMPSLVFDGYYMENDLFKTIIKDENWKPSEGDDHTVHEFKNRQGQVILKRTFDNNISFNTQYVYDDFGNLTYVLSPKGSDLVFGSDSVTIDGKVVIVQNPTRPAPINNGNITLSVVGTNLVMDVNLIMGGGYGPQLNASNTIFQIPFSLPNMTIGTIDNTASGTSYQFEIQDGWLKIEGTGDLTERTTSLSAQIPQLTIDQTAMNALGYQYRYDDRNRLIEKKIPQKGWEYIVYDKLDRPVLTQDARLHETNQWLFTKYDDLNRVTYTGMVSPSCSTTPCSRAEMQNQVGAQTGISESKQMTSNTVDGTELYYSNSVYPTQNITIFTINYYDDYNFDWGYNNNNLPNPTNATEVNHSNNLQGLTSITSSLLTGSKVRVLDTNDWIVSYSSYDSKGRSIFAGSYNEYLGTTDIIKTHLDFVGNVMQSISNHTKGSTVIETIDDFEYDHQNRLLTHKQSINGQAQQLITENHYDNLGQLELKEVGGAATSSTALQNIDYSYNVRGWLKEINDVGDSTGNDLFNFSIAYDQPSIGVNINAVPLFNGNISQTQWRTPNADQSNIKAYNYSYDALNRFENAVFSEFVSTSSSFEASKRYQEYIKGYDKNGNIKGIFRTGSFNDDGFIKVWDNIEYSYDGNQLVAVTDNPQYVATLDYVSTLEEGFVDGNTTNTDYMYDVNGNMTSDANKGITNITYNHLNLPTQIDITSTTTMPGGGSGSSGAIVFDDNFSDGTVEPWTEYPGMPTPPSIQGGALQVHLVRGVPYPGAYIQESLESGHQHTVTFDVTDLPTGYQVKFEVRKTLETPEHSFSIVSNGSYSFTFITNDIGNHYVNFLTNNKGYGGNDPADFYSFKLDNFTIMDDDATYSGPGGTVSTINGSISYIYDATGTKLKKIVENLTDQLQLNKKEYAGGYIYEDGALAMISQPEGYIEPVGSSFKYAFNYTDHLGNVRLTYSDQNQLFGNPVSLEIIEESHYYPFGLEHKGYNNVVNGTENNHKTFQGQEMSKELGYNMHEYKFRHYDAAIARFVTIDPLATDYTHNSTYAFSENRVIDAREMEGLEKVIIISGATWDKTQEATAGVKKVANGINAYAKEIDMKSGSVVLINSNYWNPMGVLLTAYEEAKSADPNEPLIIYGYSKGGEIAQELSRALEDIGIDVDLLFTIDAADGWYNFTVDREISDNVLENVNYFQRNGGISRSRGNENKRKDGTTRGIYNINLSADNDHYSIDDDTAENVINRAVADLKKYYDNKRAKEKKREERKAERKKKREGNE